jgi:hypothetical protein
MHNDNKETIHTPDKDQRLFGRTKQRDLKESLNPFDLSKKRRSVNLFEAVSQSQREAILFVTL